MTALDIQDTIVAIASAAGGSLRGIIRISGEHCESVLQAAFANIEPSFFCSIRTASLIDCKLTFHDSSNCEPVELPGQLIFWPTGRSYTGQPSAEFHTFGSPPCLNLAIGIFCEAGARLAQPGEFTLRAFLSGRLDLTQAESVLAIIDADERQQLDGALQQLAGGLSGPLSIAREQLLFVLAELEAGLDFVEEDIEFISPEQLKLRLQEVSQTLNRISSQIHSRNTETKSVRVVLVGLPNAGKSRLFNSLLGYERAIVSNIAGTTTDAVSAQWNVAGMEIELVDTAGLESIVPADLRTDLETHPPERHPQDEQPSETRQANVIEQAQHMRGSAESAATLVLLCIDDTRLLTNWETDQLQRLDERTIVVRTKSDLRSCPRFLNPQRVAELISGWQFVTTSAIDSNGIAGLMEVIARKLAAVDPTLGEIVQTTVVRVADSLQHAAQSVNRALTAVSENRGEEIVAAEIRSALDDLGYVVGAIYTDDILDVVFSRFCIGK